MLQQFQKSFPNSPLHVAAGEVRGPGLGKRPVEHVGYLRAQAFVEKAGERLLASRRCRVMEGQCSGPWLGQAPASVLIRTRENGTVSPFSRVPAVPSTESASHLVHFKGDLLQGILLFSTELY